MMCQRCCSRSEQRTNRTEKGHLMVGSSEILETTNSATKLLHMKRP